MKNIPSVVLGAMFCAVVAIQPAGAAPARHVQGGAIQRTSVEGCIGHWLFDGVWRLRVVSVEKSTFSTGPYGDSGYAVRVQVRNGTSKEREIKYTGFGGEGAGHMSLILSDDSSYTVASSTGSYITDFYAFSSTTLAPGANANATLKFIVPAEVLSSPATPKKLLIAVDPKAINPNYSGFRYPIADPSFRVFLKCKTSVKSADGKTP